MKDLTPILIQIVFCDSIYRMYEAIDLSLNNNVGTQVVNDILLNILGQNWHLWCLYKFCKVFPICYRKDGNNPCRFQNQNIVMYLQPMGPV